MRYGWSQHVETARVIAATAPVDQGAALALMGVALLMLAQDLLQQESPIALILD